jgi:predicted GNAT family N-acyltransferase
MPHPSDNDLAEMIEALLMLVYDGKIVITPRLTATRQHLAECQICRLIVGEATRFRVLTWHQMN